MNHSYNQDSDTFSNIPSVPGRVACSDLTEANGENPELPSSENALCVVVLGNKGRPLLRNAMGLAFTEILNYLDQKKSNPHKQFWEKKLLGFYFLILFFFLWQNMLYLISCSSPQLSIQREKFYACCTS